MTNAFYNHTDGLPSTQTRGISEYFRDQFDAIALGFDGVEGSSAVQSQWITYAPTATFINTTSFSVVGDQTGTFEVGRRVKTTNTGGTFYGRIATSVFGAVTTVTLTDTTGNLDIGLSATAVGLLTETNFSVPLLTVPMGGTGRVTSTTAYALLAAGTTATGTQQTLGVGATTDVLVGAGASALPVWTAATGSGAPVRATSPTLVTPALGTPSALVLTNATGLPIAGGGTGGTTAATARAALLVAPLATRSDVASVAGTVDLTTSVPNSDDIRITGALTITAFTIAAGRVIRVTAGGAFTLTNNASIVTNRGANVTFKSGDEFSLRATAANVVEVLGAAQVGVNSDITSMTAVTALPTALMPLGVGQTWQNLTGSRAIDTTYNNSSGRPIEISICLINYSGGVNKAATLYIGGIIVAHGDLPPFYGEHARRTFSGVVPPGADYVLSTSNSPDLLAWAELRA